MSVQGRLDATSPFLRGALLLASAMVRRGWTKDENGKRVNYPGLWQSSGQEKNGMAATPHTVHGKGDGGTK